MGRITVRRLVILAAVLTVGVLTLHFLKVTPAPEGTPTASESTPPVQTTSAPTPTLPPGAGTTNAPGVIYPDTVTQTQMDDTVLRLYREWKAKYIKPNPYDATQYYVWYSDGDWFTQNEATVSEAHGYGMLLTALMASKDTEAQPIFDSLYRYYTAHPSMYHSGLMAWQQADDGKALVDINGADSATDGDLDIAYALLLANRQWGSDGPINYRRVALDAIAAILQGDVNQTEWTLKLGDWANDQAVSTRPSDFIFDHLKAFAQATGDDRWNNIVDTTYALMRTVHQRYSPDTGLMPDFLVKEQGEYRPAKPNFLEAETDGSYSYNACRVPWRVTTDYLVSGDDRALPQLTKLNRWIKVKSDMDPSNIRTGYQLDGTAIGDGTALCFTAPLMVSAMIGPENQEWLNKLWQYNMGFPTGETLYYDNALRLLCAVVVSGNWVQP